MANIQAKIDMAQIDGIDILPISVFEAIYRSGTEESLEMFLNKIFPNVTYVFPEDLNSVQGISFFSYNETTINTPQVETSGFGLSFNFANNPTYSTQIAFQKDENELTDKTRTLWIRQQYEDGWGDWGTISGGGGDAETLEGKPLSAFRLKEIPIVTNEDYNTFENGIVYAMTGCANAPIDNCIVETNIASNNDGVQKAYCVNTRIAYNRRRATVGGWSTWSQDRDGGNAYTLDGKTSEDYVQWIGDISATIANDNTHPVNYQGTISGTEAEQIDLVGISWSFEYRRSTTNIDGFGTEIAHPINNSLFLPMYRTSDGNSWGEWERYADGGDAKTFNGKNTSDFVLSSKMRIEPTAPSSPESNTLWIW